MRHIQAIALACMVATPLAFAQAPANPAKMQLATKMYDISEAGTVFQALEYNVVGNIMGGIGQGLGDKATCPALQPEAQTFKGKMDTLFTSMNDASFRQQASQVYADTFTDDEMKQIITFMQSPAGQKMKRVQPDLVKRIGAIAEARAKTHEADIKSDAQSFAIDVNNIAKTCPSTAPAAAGQPPKK
jgi:hypothetical protein